MKDWAINHSQEAKRLRSGLLDARYRPRYHFLPPSGWMNDPNGVIYWRGRYHLFFQYNPHGPVWGDIHWGHAVSDDLIHWEDLPVALTPTPGGPDEGGCWSGCAVDNGGVPTVFYTGIRGAYELARSQVTCVAVGSNDLVTWQKHPANPVLTAPEGLNLIGFRDPSVWRDGNVWYQLVGSGVRGVGGAVLLYRSRGLLEWEYLGPLITGEEHALPLWTGSIWECPQLLAFGDKHVLIFGVWDDRTHYTVAMTGRLRGHRFVPEQTRKLDAGDRHFYAAQALTDETGRRLMWGWIQEDGDARHEAGWSGVMSLPRELALAPDGTLRMKPPEELKGLREAHTRRFDLALRGAYDLGVRGVQLELHAHLSPNGSSCGLSVLRAPDGAEETRIFYDPARHKLGVDRRRSSLTTGSGLSLDVQEGDFALRAGESLELRVFLDHSVVEVFANNRFCVTSRVYPQRQDSTGVCAFGDGADLKTADIWTLRSIW